MIEITYHALSQDIIDIPDRVHIANCEKRHCAIGRVILKKGAFFRDTRLGSAWEYSRGDGE